MICQQKQRRLADFPDYQPASQQPAILTDALAAKRDCTLANPVSLFKGPPVGKKMSWQSIGGQFLNGSKLSLN